MWEELGCQQSMRGKLIALRDDADRCDTDGRDQRALVVELMPSEQIEVPWWRLESVAVRARDDAQRKTSRPQNHP